MVATPSWFVPVRADDLMAFRCVPVRADDLMAFQFVSVRADDLRRMLFVLVCVVLYLVVVYDYLVKLGFCFIFAYSGFDFIAVVFKRISN